jgi:large subunit ribosomal protein L8e
LSLFIPVLHAHAFVLTPVRPWPNNELLDPRHRCALLARVVFHDPYCYKLHKETFITTEDLHTGVFVYTGKKATLGVGNILPVGQCPKGTIVCNREQKVGDLAHMLGNYAIVIGNSPKENKTHIWLLSGAKKTVSGTAHATIGIVAVGGCINKPLLKASPAYRSFRLLIYNS